VHFADLDHAAAVDEFEHAITLNANFVTAHYYLGRSLSSRGDAVTALRHIEQAIRLSPRDPNIGHFHIGAARAYLFLGEYEKSAQLAKQGLRHQNLSWSAPTTLASALGHLGQRDEAQRAIEEMQRLRPGITIAFVRERLPITDEGYMNQMLEGLRKAGLPE
jgi:tetratricopeptide (TPR) repeat protein